MEYTYSYITELVRTIEYYIRQPPKYGVVSHETVEALNILSHALEFTHHPQSLQIWRAAFWRHQLCEEAKQALIQMFEYLDGAIVKGENEAASKICDCLQVVADLALTHAVKVET
jgi:hypothetical protein